MLDSVTNWRRNQMLKNSMFTLFFSPRITVMLQSKHSIDMSRQWGIALAWQANLQHWAWTRINQTNACYKGLLICLYHTSCYCRLCLNHLVDQSRNISQSVEQSASLLYNHNISPLLHLNHSSTDFWTIASLSISLQPQSPNIIEDGANKGYNTQRLGL